MYLNPQYVLYSSSIEKYILINWYNSLVLTVILYTIQLFTNLRINSPEAFDRIVPVAGDISKPGIGISKEDKNILVENVSIVFHLAATVRFDAPLRDALQYNVIAVRDIINLCHKMKKLKVCLNHVNYHNYIDNPKFINYGQYFI